MGMYTELIFGASLKRDTPQKIIDTINYYLNSKPGEKEPANLDWKPISRNPLCAAPSVYFGINKNLVEFWHDGSWHLSIRTNLKNYDNDIESFLGWIKPHVQSGSGVNELYAIVMYEEWFTPRLYYLKNYTPDYYFYGIKEKNGKVELSKEDLINLAADMLGIDASQINIK